MTPAHKDDMQIPEAFRIFDKEAMVHIHHGILLSR